MSENLVISQSCLIEKNMAILNGKVVFEKPGQDTAGFLMDMYKHTATNYPKFYKMDKLCKLGFLAGELLLKDPDVFDGYDKDEIAIVLYNANASLEADQQYFNSVSEIPSPALFIYTLPNILIGELCIRHGIKGENIFFLQETFQPKSMVDYVGMLLSQDIAQACLCGWVDLLGEEYKACLMWVEKNKSGEMFSTAIIDTIYNQNHG
jgi:hypothetical protein